MLVFKLLFRRGLSYHTADLLSHHLQSKTLISQGKMVKCGRWFFWNLKFIFIAKENQWASGTQHLNSQRVTFIHFSIDKHIMCYNFHTPMSFYKMSSQAKSKVHQYLSTIDILHIHQEIEIIVTVVTPF